MMKTELYDYFLPTELVANSPAHPRDSSRLMCIDKLTGKISHHIFRHLPQILRPSDVLVFNDTKVFPARLHGVKSTGGKVEVLLLTNLNNGLWEVISHPGLKPHQTMIFSPHLSAQVITPNTIEFQLSDSSHKLMDLITELGFTPIPPYIHSSASEQTLRREYQTVYARLTGSAAAPTAGLHFTPGLLTQLSEIGVQQEFLTLHVGLGTFKPPSPEQLAAGKLHSEWYSLDIGTAARLNTAKLRGQRIIAVGTTTTRVLETLSDPSGHLSAGSGQTDIFIKPPYTFKFVSGLLTNFHLPQSSLLMLVSAFSTPEIIKGAYLEAVKNRYRFFSFGDATLIT